MTNICFLTFLQILFGYPALYESTHSFHLHTLATQNSCKSGQRFKIAILQLAVLAHSYECNGKDLLVYIYSFGVDTMM